MFICCRYITECSIRERFLGFVHVTDLSAKGLADVIAETLTDVR
jgi:hypothetical protein